ncbi:hypothetical protein ONS96_003887 [Cadophora gregata f. sp. sojae]|nr:hypothetical protein ONS96_003887 [Cadophora gregata f. sp. sojae]
MASTSGPVILPTTLEPADFNLNYVMYWNNVALDLNRITHSIAGPYTGPPLSARALSILHLAIHDCYFAIHPDMAKGFSTFLDPNSTDPLYRLPPVGNATDARSAVAAASIRVLNRIYATPNSTIATATTETISQFIQDATANFAGIEAISPSYLFGVAVANAVLKLLYISPDDDSVNQGSYRPVPGQFKFDGDPSNPVRIFPVNPNDPNGPTKAVAVFHLPYYGILAKRVAVQMNIKGQPTEHILADPPNNIKRPQDLPEWEDSLKDIIRMGGPPDSSATKRRPDQRAGAIFWAYDGSNLLGTPPRFYNQILRRIAIQKMPDNPTSERTNADFARLFALVNASMADAGILAWKTKWFYEYWRPETGVRETESSLADPFFLSLGAPDTNSNRISFKPPFPAYPSGHATFGGAVFQMMRLYYRQRDGLMFDDNAPDTIAFQMTSDELNGINRDLREPYDRAKPIQEQQGIVRTLRPPTFSSLWHAIFENGVSRVWLGVHWRSDAFAAKDVLVPSSDPEKDLYATNADGTTAYIPVDQIRYQTLGTRDDRPGQLFPIGGVPLGIQIAEDIFYSGLKPTPAAEQPAATV